MKKVLIAIIGSNNVYGIPLHNNLEKFDDCIRKIISYGIIALSKKSFDALPSKSPPFAEQTTYIVSAEPIDINSDPIRTYVVQSWQELFDILPDTGSETLYIFLNSDNCEELFKPQHIRQIDSVIVAEVDKEFPGNEIFQHPPFFDWLSMIMCEEKSHGKRSPGFVVHQHTKT